MKYIPAGDGEPTTVELTRRNLEVLLAKLDDPGSAATLMKQQEVDQGDEWVRVRAVENEDHYHSRPPGAMYMPSTGAVL